MRNKKYKNGLTLVELLVALMVTTIVLTAVATLAFALGNVNDTSDDTSRKQAQVRYTTLRISELIKNSRLVCGSYGDDLAIWRADDNGDDNINPTELIYLEAGVDRSYIKLLEFTSGVGNVLLTDIQNGTAKPTLISSCNYRRTVLVPECSYVQFQLDDVAPQSKFVSVTFNLLESDAVRQYQTNAALRGWAGNLLNEDGDAIVSDDD